MASKSEEEQSASQVEAGAAPTIKWDDSQMNSAYANVCNVASTREEVTLFFGTNQTWNAASSNQITISLTDRIILSPFAAKRLHVLLGNVLNEYEAKFGKLEFNVAGSADPTSQ
jgi:hypothetical protein